MSSAGESTGPARGPWLPGLLALLVAAPAVVADLLIPAGFTLTAVYGVPLLVGARGRSTRLLWGLATLLVTLTLVFTFWRPNQPASEAQVFVSRLLSAVGTLVVAGLLQLWMTTERTALTSRQALEERNAELEAVNDELGQREEEIVRQNEELQAQTEELERQSEELRVTNEELANREKALEHLLELSRSLTAELSRDDLLKKICEALGLLTQGNASAILEKRGPELVLLCHHGFGSDGPEAEAIPFDHSFGSLIMSRGQTGYLEDAALRPDLRLPRPARGEPFRAVLSSPLRVHGHCVGVVEVYAYARQAWSDAHVALVESLAAQASISLQSAELIEEIRQERRRFETVFRTVPFGILVAEDPDGQRVRANPAAAALFQVPQDENLSPASPAGARLLRAIFRGARPAPLDGLPLARALRGEETQGEELDLVFPGGRRLTLLVSAAPLLDGKGRVVGAVSGFADVTALKALQRELDVRRREAEEASVRKTRFLAAVSHDIRTPANAINLMAEVIRRSAGNPALAGGIPELAHKLQANTLSLVELVSDVLDVARFDSGKVELQESEFLLNDLLFDECRQLLPLAQDKGLGLEVEPPDRPVWLRADRVKLARVVGNLVGNAIKFTDAGAVRVSAGLTPDRQAVLRVRDTGVGIAPEHQARVFDEFAQLRNPARDPSKGTGLGLAICKRLVEVMGGHIAVESTPGRGSTFAVTLPASCVLLRLEAGAPAAPRGGPEPAPAPGGRLAGMRVLLVEDHTTTREGTTHILKAEGAHVLEAADGRSALELLRREQIDVVLLDMMLPDMDGREVLKALQAQRPGGLRAVLVLTGDLTSERLDEVKRLGADALIGKPIDVGKLMAALHTVRGPAG